MTDEIHISNEGEGSGRSKRRYDKLDVPERERRATERESPDKAEMHVYNQSRMHKLQVFISPSNRLLSDDSENKPDAGASVGTYWSSHVNASIYPGSYSKTQTKRNERRRIPYILIRLW